MTSMSSPSSIGRENSSLVRTASRTNVSRS
jgi:hypothetical protein